MPLLFPILLLVLIFALLPVLLPLSIFQRYRVGTRRQSARGWLATTNVVALSLSASMLLCAALLTNLWLPHAFVAALGGLAGGGLLGLAGLATTRWEAGPAKLHYTPNRFLVGAILLVVIGRLLYGFWRGWTAWQSAADEGSWLVASGAAGSLAAGAMVIGYYLIFWAGVRRRLKSHRRATGVR